MSNNYWLWSQLRDNKLLVIEDCFDPLITLNTNHIVYKIYSPSHAEYIVSIDIVQKVMGLGGNIISYPTSWSSATQEAKIYGERNGVKVIPHGELFHILGK